MKYFSMFSGIGGFELGIQRVCPDWECVGFSEIDKYAKQIYQKHFPNHRSYDDATRINTKQIPDFNLLVGGFPCQSFSIAGKRGGIKDTRGSLFFEIARIISVKRPQFLLLENVKGLLSHDNGQTFGTILSTLSRLGYVCEWQILNSKNFGVPQRRERLFIIGYLGKQSRQKIFPFRENDKIYIYQNRRTKSETPYCTTITTKGTRKESTYIKTSEGIRTLTPLESERAQGFPDNYTKTGISNNNEIEISDTIRIHCLGNAVTVNFIEAIIKQIKKHNVTL